MSPQDLINKISGKITDQRFKWNRRLSVLLLFVGIATFLWFLRALEKEYYTRINHPVMYQNLPETQILVNDLPQKLSLEVYGTGFAILRHNWDISKSPIKINIRQFLQNGKEESSSLVLAIPSVQIKNRIGNQLTNLEVRGVSPDSLVLIFSPEYTKKLPVIAHIDIELEKQYMIKDQVIIKPDSVTVKGPELILDTLTRIYTNQHHFRKVDQSQKRNISLLIPHDQVELSDKKVLVEIPVEQYTEKTVSVPVIPVNVPDSLMMKTFPAHVQITFRVIVSAYEKIQANDFLVWADYKNAENSKNRKIKPQLHGIPPQIENPRIHPEVIDFLLEKND